MKIIMILLASLMVVLAGCKQDVYGCIVGGIELKDLELCKSIQESERENYELGKLIGEDCGEEVTADIYDKAYNSCLDKFSRDMEDNCLLVITDGYKPLFDGQSRVDTVFEIRTWNLTSQQIEDRFSSDDFRWKYYIACGE